MKPCDSFRTPCRFFIEKTEIGSRNVKCRVGPPFFSRGDTSPNFTLNALHDSAVELKQLTANKPVVLVYLFQVAQRQVVRD